ncbi:hypothetical protein [Thetidibacter halocola]|uniref:Uncharacterized protein n=1 Tax=Thetidibacter halocola TaxID=2827239 RepID=A0A8J8B8E2_9RHOB|nr:hypothetical protein [Thetidibacter halocola]MBS0124455.1 hypothetical protein [Thetidibacter halocola]
MTTNAAIEELWICPPLAPARFGQLDKPMVNFHWEQNDYSSHGTAETVIRSTIAFKVGEDGCISAYMPTEIRFRDRESCEDQWRWLPVASFFALHGGWTMVPKGRSPPTYPRLAV